MQRFLDSARFGGMAWLWAGCFLVLTGCAPSTSPDAAAGNAASDEISRAIAQLPPADQEAARRQRLCPVSDEPLGSMGAPYKMTVEGTDVYLCCEGCKELVHEQPAKYLAKLKK